MAAFLNQLDEQLSKILSSYNVWTAIIGAGIIGLLTVIFLLSTDPDIHPLILARAASPGFVRQPGESAVYRAHEVAHGYPLKTGLNVRYPGDPSYYAGRDGTLKDIWNRVTGALPLSGSKGEDGEDKPPGKILTVLGKEIIDHDIDDITREINIIGKHVTDSKATRIAVYLPNSIELLATIFGGACYGFTTILIPYNQSHEKVVSLLRQCKADFLVAEAGSLPLGEVAQGLTSLKEAIWVVERTSRHMDWKDVPSEVGGRLEVSVWHELVQDHYDGASTSLPDTKADPGPIVTVWQDRPGLEAEITEFSHKNIVAAVGAAITALPTAQRLSESDMFLPIESLTQSYCLVQTLAALYQKATVALNSVAGAGVLLTQAASSVSPTVVVAPAETAANMHNAHIAGLTNPFHKLRHTLATRTLAGGTLPKPLSATSTDSNQPGKLRLLLLSDRAGCQSSPPLSERALSDLRAATGARVVYALTAAKVAGAVAQTGVYDYRVDAGRAERQSHFGAPLHCVEIKVVDTDSVKTTDEKPQGEIVVTGPSVAGDGTANVGVLGYFRDDYCLAYL